MLPHAGLYPCAWGAAALLWVLCGVLALRRLVGARRRAARVAALLGAVLLAAVAGARVHFLLLSPDLLSEGLAAWSIRPDGGGFGLRIAGGLLAAATVLAVAGPSCLDRETGRWAILDRLVPPAGIAIAVGRLGCLADGCCFGVPCDLPWCPAFPAGSPAYWSHVARGLATESVPASLPVHPLQLYLAGAGLAAWLASRAPLRRRWPDGTAALLFVLVLSCLRVAIEPLRESSFGGGVAHQEAVAAACAGVAATTLAWRLQLFGRGSSRSAAS